MKAILVIDIPDDVELSNAYAQVITYFGCKSIKDFPGSNYKIKPMPKKKKFSNEWAHEHFFYGWNACIDEILGETE